MSSEWGIWTDAIRRYGNHSNPHVGGSVQTEVALGTQRADRRTWIIRDPKEGTIRRIIALLSGRTGDRTSLIARLATTPWSRKRQVMIRKDQPTMSSRAPEEESVPGGQTRAEQGGKETMVASQRSHSEKGFLCADWQRKWETSLGRATNNEYRPSGSFRESTAAWLREQVDWNGSKAISEDWVLLEGRACEIARAQAQLDLQQAHEQGTVTEYLQSLRQRGYVGLANAGLTILEAEGKSMQEQDRRQHQDQVSVMGGLIGLGSAVCTPVMGGQRNHVELRPAGI